MGQEFPVPRSDFQREMVAGQRCVSQQLIDLLSVYRIAGNQILLGTKFIRVLSEKRLRCLGPLLLQVLQPLRLLGAQRLPVQSGEQRLLQLGQDRKSTRLNSSHVASSYAVFCLKKK